MGNKAVVPNAVRGVVEGGKILDEFFDVIQVEMEVKRTVQTEIKGKKVSRLLRVLVPEEMFLIICKHKIWVIWLIPQ